ncbi:hypothetical protein HispidOSU_002773, partial [Sigmodon hispidus]
DSKEPSSTPAILTKRQVKQKTESMTTQLQLLTSEINALEDHLISVIEAPLEY